jgi:ferredoxin--NADP+ reductase
VTLDTAVAERPQERKSARTGGLNRERVLSIKHYTDKLFSFRTTRTPSFRFASGQFAMIGLEVDGRPLLRAYSMTSGHYDDWLEFFSIKVPDGPLTSRLQHIQPGDEILVSAKPTGTLLVGNLRPGRRLILLATGTGFAPFASILRDPETYENIDTVLMAYGCRVPAELEFGTNVVMGVRSHELIGELAAGKLLYYATVTRAPYHHQGRLTDLVVSGKLFRDIDEGPLDPEGDRIMICGNPALTADLRKLLGLRGFTEGANNAPAEFVVEKAFVDR